MDETRRCGILRVHLKAITWTRRVSHRQGPAAGLPGFPLAQEQSHLLPVKRKGKYIKINPEYI